MVGYRKGTTPESELERLREAFASAAAAIYAQPDAHKAWEDAGKLIVETRRLQGEAGAYRGYLALHLLERYGLTMDELAQLIGTSRPRASQIITEARKRGNPVTEPTKMPELPIVVVAVIVSPRGVVVCERADKVPPFTFPGGEMHPGESAHGTAMRRVLAEAGLDVIDTRTIGRRVHPNTSRFMIYVHAVPHNSNAELRNSDTEDITRVMWADFDETRTLMPDMFEPVRQFLNDYQRSLRD